MLVLRMTSPTSVRGLKSDDGFTIGRLSAETAFLVLFATAVGIIGGLAYLALRQWIPRWRGTAAAVFFGVVGGAVFVHPDGVDFTRLSPKWLAITLFTLLPAAYGLALSWSVDRLLVGVEARPWTNRRLAIAIVPLALVMVTGPPGILLMLVFAGAVVAGRAPGLVRHLRSPVATWLGRALLAAVAALATVNLGQDVVAIL